MKQVLPPQQLESGWLDVKAERAQKESTGFFGGGAPGDVAACASVAQPATGPHLCLRSRRQCAVRSRSPGQVPPGFACAN